MLVALAGTQIYSWTRPFPDNAGDRLAEAAQWTTFFTFLAALMILLDVDAANSTDQTIFGVLLIVIQSMPLAIGVGVAALNKRKDKKAKGKRHTDGQWYKDHQEDEREERQEQIEEACAGDEPSWASMAA